jgi:probable HAF family extracellular repeat protein
MDSGGAGINRAGDVTGWSPLPDGSSRAFIYSGGVMRALDTFSGGGDGYGNAINDLGQVTGSASADRVFQHAFLYTNGTMLDLGTVRDDNSIGDSFGYAINSRGDVTGYYDVALGCLCRAWNSFRAFLYTDGTMYDLSSLVVSGLDGFTLTQAAGINDHRQIAATGGNGHEMRAFRLDPIPDPPTAAVEYHHAGFDHYFLTANPDEIAALDNGVFLGWARTGQTFNVYVDAPIGTNATCRFFSAAFSPKSSHFYTAFADECAKVKTNPDWQFEGIVFNIAVPDQNGSCPSNTQPVYRLYNNGQGAAPNHRFTTSLAVRSQMVAAGWVPEGPGGLGVGMCAPQ